MKNFSFEKQKDFGTLIAIKKENKYKNLTLAGGTNPDVYLKDRLY